MLAANLSPLSFPGKFWLVIHKANISKDLDEEKDVTIFLTDTKHINAEKFEDSKGQNLKLQDRQYSDQKKKVKKDKQ